MSEEPKAISSFRLNVAHVNELMTFDDKVTEHVHSLLTALVRRQQSAKLPMPPHFDAEPTLRMIEGIRGNASLKPYYQSIVNQCMVLLVSHFAAAARDLYISSIARAYDFIMQDGLWSEKLEITVGELSQTDSDSLPTIVGELLSNRTGVSFQDMKSIGRAFKTHCGYEPERDADVEGIIVAQACRHALVHDGGNVGKRLLKQVEGCKGHSLRVALHEGEPIAFTA